MKLGARLIFLRINLKASLTKKKGEQTLQGLSEPEFYGDLVDKFRKIIGKIDFPYHFKNNCSL